MAEDISPFPDLGRDGFKEFAAAFNQGFPGVEVVKDEEIRSGDTTAYRWTASGVHKGETPMRRVSPTGRTTRVPGSHFIHWRNGQAAEVWHHGDWLGWLQQAGVGPPLA